MALTPSPHVTLTIISPAVICVDYWNDMRQILMALRCNHFDRGLLCLNPLSLAEPAMAST